MRVVARLPVSPVPLPRPEAGPSSGTARSRRRLWDNGTWVEGVVVERATLASDEKVKGPAVVTEAGATTFVPQGFVALVAPDGSIRIRRIH